MKMIKQFTCYVLLCMTAVSALSCSHNENDDIQTTASPSKETVQNAETDNANERLLVSDGLPDKDFGGASYTMYLRRDPICQPDDFCAEASSGDIIEDAVYKRNLKISERFNIQFAYHYDETQTTTYDTTAILSIRAGEDVNDILGLHGAYCFHYAMMGYLLDWNTFMTYNDLSKHWWDDDFRNNMTVADKLFGMTGSISHSSIGGTFCLLFNKNLFNTYDIPYPYQDVKDGTWTFDRLCADALAIRADLNGDGVIEPEADQYGLYSNSWGFPICAFYMAGDRVITNDVDGQPKLTLLNERTSGIMDALKQFYAENGVYIMDYSGDYTEDIFHLGRAAFVGAAMKSLQKYRDMDIDIGVVPYPKYDESVSRYYSLVDAGKNVFAIPTTVQGDKLERVSIITEALAAEGWKTVVPTFYEDALKTKYARDAESEEMLEIITASRYFDYGYYDTNISWDLSYIGRTMLNVNQDLATYYESQRKSAEKNLQKTYETYRDLE